MPKIHENTGVFETDLSSHGAQITAWKGQGLLPEKLLKLKNSPERHVFHLGWFQDGEVLAVGSFLSHRLLHAGDTVFAYQVVSFRVADYRIAKIALTALINEACAILQSRAAAFLFWLSAQPHTLPTPIEVGFEDRGAFVTIRIPRLNYFLNRFFNKHQPDLELVLENGLHQNNFDLINMRRNDWNERVCVAEDHTSTSMWGKVKTRHILGIPFRGMMVGGMNLSNPFHIDAVFREAFRSLRLHWIRVTFHHSSNLKQLFRKPWHFRHTGRLFIKSTDGKSPRFENLHFFAALFDSF